MDNPKLIPIEVDGIVYGYVSHDFGSYNRFTIYCDGKVIGQKNMPIRVGIETKLVTYIVRSILEVDHGPAV